MDTDLNTLRSLVTVMFFAVFLTIIAWAFSRRNQHLFDEAADLPFQGDTDAQASIGGTHE